MALDPVTAGIDLVSNVGSALIKHFFPDPSKQAEAEAELAKLQTSGVLAQIAGQLEINKAEAASTNWFIAGWRPAVGWICAAAFAYAAILEPIVRFVALTIGYKGGFPVLDTGVMVSTLFGMLGIGGLRTFEKFKGAEGNR